MTDKEEYVYYVTSYISPHRERDRQRDRDDVRPIQTPGGSRSIRSSGAMLRCLSPRRAVQ